MKKSNIFTFFLGLIFTLATSLIGNAQNNFAHINTQQLLGEMPEVIAVNKELENLEKQYSTELDSSVKEYQTKAQNYAADAENQSDLINQQRSRELESMQQNIAEFRQSASLELQKKQGELMNPLMDKARVAIEKVAEAQGFDYVLDSSPGGSLIVSKGKDLMADVKRELGF
ncbi:MAG: OmpH family outer membrane protein [Flavobacteriaceae bacterium]|nr:OmpH family outer membrane protein [Flavobacteriaceae bacterium]